MCLANSLWVVGWNPLLGESLFLDFQHLGLCLSSFLTLHQSSLEDFNLPIPAFYNKLVCQYPSDYGRRCGSDHESSDYVCLRTHVSAFLALIPTSGVWGQRTLCAVPSTPLLGLLDLWHYFLDPFTARRRGLAASDKPEVVNVAVIGLSP